MEKRTSIPENKYDITPVKNTLSNLLNKTINSIALKEKEFNFIIQIIEIYPYILDEIGFNPDRFHLLMEKNDNLATEIFFKLINCSLFEDYLSLFIEKNFSVNSLKIMNKLIQKIEIPSCFIKSYIRHIIMEYKNQIDIWQKERIAKLFSFFLLNLLDNKHITIDIIPISINEILDKDYKDPDITKLKERIISFRN